MGLHSSVSSRQYPRLLIQPQDAVRQSCRQEEGRRQGQGQVGSEEDGEDEEGVEEGGEEEGEDDRQEGEDKEAFWCKAKERAKEKGNQGREEKVKGWKESLRSSLHCLVQLSPSCPSEYK